jgi:cellulose synthase/poly-beta-1,6-N-acetylglucosamine synthase-like glycosyltransferase
MTSLGIVLCIVAFLGVLYPHVLYPWMLRVLAQRFRRPIADQRHEPMVDVCIAAFNEERYIDRCLKSLSVVDYPASRMRILVGDDGSEDETIKVVQQVEAEYNMPIHILPLPRTGKNGVLNALIDRTESDVIIFMDADCEVAPDAFTTLVAPFADETVGAAIGRLDRSIQQASAESGERGEATYKSIEDPINRNESTIHSTVTSNGALYAVRKALLSPLPNGRVADDWYNVLQAAHKGKRIIYVPEAKVRESRGGSMQGEVARTVRTASSGMLTLWSMRTLLKPTSWVAFFLWSHRIVRWLSPLFLVLLIIGTAFTVRETALFGILFYAQFTFYALALLGYAASTVGQRIPLISTITYFVAMNGAFALAMVRSLRRSDLDQWSPSIVEPS